MPTARTVTVAAAALAYGWWATGLPPFSLASTLAVVGAGLVAVAAGSRVHRPRPDVAGVDPFGAVVLLGLLAGWQLAAYLQHPRREHPTLSSLLNVLLDGHAARALAFVLWLTGAALLARR